MPSRKPHSLARVLRVGPDSFDIAPDHPETGFLLQQMTGAKVPVVVERKTSGSFRVRALTPDELQAERGKLIQSMTRAWVDRGSSG